jgi:hypothetical protein
MFCALTGAAHAITSGADGQQLMDEALRRYAPPAHVYEEQAWIVTDRQGQPTVRTVRYFALSDAAGSRCIWTIETPTEARGANVRVDHEVRGATRHGAAASSAIFGSNFLVADLEGERAGQFRYERDGDMVIDRVPHFVLKAIAGDAALAQLAGYHERRIYLRKDNLFISRIDFRDREGRQIRRQTFRDPAPDDAGVWRANMVLMEDLRSGERSLLKIERRVHSADYVPMAMFAGSQEKP